MTIKDLSNAQRASLLRKLRRREAMEQQGVNPPSGLHLNNLMAEYSLNYTEMIAVLNGMKGEEK